MQTFLDGFDDIARRHEDRLALRDSAMSLTYGELAGQVCCIAANVHARLDRPGPVAVLAPHGATAIAALLGVLASGRGVIPLDADHPEARNQLIARQSEAAGVVTTEAAAEKARALFDSSAAVIVIDHLDGKLSHPAPSRPSPDDLAYVLYTSGSTGAPKGAFQLHGPLLSDLVHSVDSFGLTPEDRAALCYPPAVAAGLRAVLGTLLAGASAHLLEPRALGSEGLVREIRERGITVFRSSATLFRHLAHAAGPEGLTSLRLVALGGDRVDWTDYDAFRRACPPEAQFASHLGATECSLYAEWFVEEAARGSGHALPVGRTVPGYGVRLLDPDGAAVAPGEIGEFVVEGPRVAQGYWRDPELTQARFTSAGSGVRAYRTGDLGRLRPDGLFEVVGRGDDQIKLHGFRIELGEIESAVRACSGVKDCAILVRRDAGGAAKGLVAYVQLGPGVQGLLKRHLTSMLGQRLPAHMIPADVVMVDELPWLANFKIDRGRLEAMDAAAYPRESTWPSEPEAATIAAVFEKVLRLKGVGPGDDLMGLGGDSLQAVDIALELERRLGAPVRAEAIDMSCPIDRLARKLRGRYRIAQTAAE